jgi:hypothetical protein
MSVCRIWRSILIRMSGQDTGVSETEGEDGAGGLMAGLNAGLAVALVAVLV